MTEVQINIKWQSYSDALQYEVKVCSTSRDTDLQTTFPAVLHDHTDIRWLSAKTKELHQVLMFHLFHLS